MAMQGLVIAGRVHVGNDYDPLLTHIHHMTPQTFFHISKIMATNNLEKLIPWTCSIQSGLQIKHHA
jgi:hypothetical protein